MWWACPSYSGCDSEIEFPLDVGCKRQGVKLNFGIHNAYCTENILLIFIIIMRAVNIIIIVPTGLRMSTEMEALSRQRGKNIGRVYLQEDSVSQGKRRIIIIIIVKAQV